MLGKKRKKKKVEEAKSKVETILGAGTIIEGNIKTKGSLRIEGKVKGKIKAEGDLFVGKKGEVENEIKARNVIVGGIIKGNVIAEGKIEILSTSKVIGDIRTETIKIEEGALFTGTSNTLKEKGKEVKVSSKIYNESLSKKDE